MKRLKIIIDDDHAVIDWLADLPDRDIIIQLDKFVRWGNRKPNAILDKGSDGRYTLVLYKPPFDANTGWNKLALFSHSELKAIKTYFRLWAERADETNPELCASLIEILELCDYQRNEEISKNSQVNFLG